MISQGFILKSREAGLAILQSFSGYSFYGARNRLQDAIYFSLGLCRECCNAKQKPPWRLPALVIVLKGSET